MRLLTAKHRQVNITEQRTRQSGYPCPTLGKRARLDLQSALRRCRVSSVPLSTGICPTTAAATQPSSNWVPEQVFHGIQHSTSHT